MSASKGPYILVTDNDSHWYVIPKSAEHDWHRWCESSSYVDDDTPFYAEAVGGAPSLVVFDSYKLE